MYNVSLQGSHDLMINLILAEVAKSLNQGSAFSARGCHVPGSRVLQMDFASSQLHLSSRTVCEVHLA